MFEISVIRDGQVIWDKEFKGYKESIAALKNKVPNREKMIEMEEKFMSLVKSDEMVARYYKIAVGVGVSLLTNQALPTYADSLSNVSYRLRQVTNPIIELLAGLGYPITYGMLITGFIMVIMGKKSRGIEILKWACIGYLGLQFVPFFLGILETLGRELRGSL